MCDTLLFNINMLQYYNEPLNYSNFTDYLKIYKNDI
jgi:hypothetical protein